jgi:hypothetical protein
MKLSRDISRPQPGYWLIKLGKGRPWTPCCILRLKTRHEPGEPSNPMERSSFLAAFINGEAVNLDDVWLKRGRAISKAEHDYQVADVAWLMQYAPDDPKGRPTEAVDWNSSPVVF